MKRPEPATLLLVALIAVLVLLVAFPALTLWLPSLMFK